MQDQFTKSGKLKALTPEELTTLDGDSAVIVCNRGKRKDGQPYWVYIAVKPSRYEELLRMTAEGKYIAFREFGEVLRYGIAEEVPEDVRDEMRLEYGWNDNYLEQLAQDITNASDAFLKEQEAQKTTRMDDIMQKLKKNEEE